MPGTIVIARPHPFIVSSMKPFLEEIGYSIVKLDHVSELAAQAPRSNGAVISLALTSPVAESAEEVFSQLRRISTRTPVLFASMLEVDQATHALEQIAKRHGFPANVMSVQSPSTSWTSLGKQESFLYLSKKDLEAPDRRAIVSQMARRHFQ
jgi:hypothetical protein